MLMRITIFACFAVMLAGCVSQSIPASPAALERASGSVLWSGLPPESHDHVNRRLDEIEALPIMRGGVLFVGDSITEAAPLDTMFPGVQSANHGIAWDTTDGVMLRMNQITRHAPDRIFLMIGTNDTYHALEPIPVSENTIEIADTIKEALPQVELYVISVLPRNEPNNSVVSVFNQTVHDAATDRPFIYLDLAQAMRAPNGELRAELTYDNLHLNDEGYRVWATVLDGCVRNGCPDGLGE
ncbi:MAG: GDSL-type esterase/lipase family protein [Pseudomonadota bacterium]